MADLNFITTYAPSFAELPAADVASTRDRLEVYIRAGFPEMDINPNTPVGDLIVTPMAYTITGLEAGMSRFMSDLNLGNVADGVIYNCDFVEKYLNNFSVDPTDSLKPSGVVRLVFSEDEDYYLDNMVRFQFNEAIFSVYTTGTKGFTIRKVGSQLKPGEDATVLKDSGSDVYFADVPVVGVSGAVDVSAGDSGLINTVMFTTLGAVTALVDFDPGVSTETLPEQANRTRKTIYSASLNTRNGAVRFIETTCPFVESCYAIKSGDTEMLRSYRGFGLSDSGCLDVYARSKSYAFTEAQVLKLYLNADGTSFDGPFDYVGQPYYIESVTHKSSDLDTIPHHITGTSTDETVVKMPMASYSPYEKLDISVTYRKDNKVLAGLENIPLYVDNTGYYTYFTIRYRTDPMLQCVANTVTSEDNAPVNMSVMVRGFIPIIIRRFEVCYVKKPGVQPLLDEARDRINVYLTSLGMPDVYTDGKINQIMDEAGVKYVKDINVAARVQWSVADRMVVGGQEEAVDAGQEINSSGGLRISYRDYSTNPSKYACSVRNVRYYLLENAITFSEVKEV